MKPEISIVLPVYNSEKTVEKTLNSIINQSYDNYEIIIINDGSTDNTEVICQNYIDKYNIKYAKINNSGVSGARNIGIEMSSGKYIMFIDSDDTYSENAIRIMYEKITYSKADLVIAGYNRINQTTQKRVTKYLDNSIYYKNEFNKVVERCQCNNLFNQVWNKIFDLEIIKENNLRFNTGISLGEDYHFVMNYIKVIDTIQISSDIIYNYTNAVDGLNCVYRKDRLDINIENMKMLEKYYLDNNFDMLYVNNKYIITFLSGINNICNNKNKAEREIELNKFINNDFIYEKANAKVSKKLKIICYILKLKNKCILKIIAKILKIYSFFNKKRLGY